jgi:hypothetical protein
MVSDAVLSELTFNQRATGSSPGRLTNEIGYFGGKAGVSGSLV